MKQLSLFFLIAFLLVGCKGSKEEVVISPLFSVCASLNPASDRYNLNHDPVVDWDDGVLGIAGTDVGLYVGRQPDFAKNGRSAGYPVDKRFILLGHEKSQEVEKLLFAQRYSKEADDFVYVMATGNKLTAATTKALMQKDFFHSCAAP